MRQSGSLQHRSLFRLRLPSLPASETRPWLFLAGCVEDTFKGVPPGSSPLFKQNVGTVWVPLLLGAVCTAESTQIENFSPKLSCVPFSSWFLNSLQASPLACPPSCPSASWKCVQGFPVWNERSPELHSFHSYSAQPIKETWKHNYSVHLQVRE